MEEGQLPGGRLRRVCRGSKFLHKPVPFLYGTNLPGKMAAGSRLTGGTKIQHMRFSPKKWPLEGALLCYSFTWWMCLLSKFPYLEGTHLFRQFVCLKKVPFKEFPWKLTSYWSIQAVWDFCKNCLEKAQLIHSALVFRPSGSSWLQQWVFPAGKDCTYTVSFNPHTSAKREKNAQCYREEERQ